MNTTPQAVSNWKSRDQVPYKYVKFLRGKIAKINQPYKSDQSIAGTGLLLNQKNSENQSEISPIDLINTIIKTVINNYILMIVFISSIIIFTFIRLSYFTSPIYFAKAKVIPQNQNGGNSSKIAGLAANFGINISSEGSGISSGDLYPDIIQSRGLCRRLLNKKFDTKKFGSQQSLLKILTYGNRKINQNQIDTLIVQGINTLLGMINVETKRLSPVITISAFSIEPKFTADLVRAVIEELDNTQKQHRLSSIREKEIFIKGRIADVEKELKKAEEKLTDFRESNRNIFSSPALQLNQERLLREVSLRSQLFTTLKREYELTQIESVENSSMLLILDEPEIPLKHSYPNLVNSLIKALLFGLVISFLFALLKDNWEKNIKNVFNDL